MTTETNPELHDRLQQTMGAVEILDLLREELEQWQQEAQDTSKREALDNVLGHLQSLEEEYKRRKEDLAKQISGSTP